MRDSAMLTPKNPSQKWLEQFLIPSLTSAPPYVLKEENVPFKLDQNECFYDWPQDFKDKVCEELKKKDWRLYTRPYDEELENLLARHLRIASHALVLSPGSNYHISLLISMFSKKAKNVVVAQPSFPLYESHCRYEGISYVVWPLNERKQYDTNLMPKLRPGSLVVLASPNNPVGNEILTSTLESLLKENPNSMFLVDEAYCEFTEQNFFPLLANFENLILVRTFSKTWAAAGIRLSYTLASPHVIFELKKLSLPFIINIFTLTAFKMALKSQELQAFFQEQIRKTIAERNWLKAQLEKSQQVSAYPSAANFLLLEFESDSKKNEMHKQLLEHGILARDVSKASGLSRCLRLGIGKRDVNTKIVELLR